MEKLLMQDLGNNTSDVLDVVDYFNNSRHNSDCFDILGDDDSDPKKGESWREKIKFAETER